MSSPASNRSSQEDVLPLCQPPDPNPRTPSLRCPPGTTDCHVHVYGPNSLYKVASTRSFDVPEALPAALRRLEDTLGVDRVVLVQPSGYGTDNSRHLDAAEEIGIPARVIVALRADVPESELRSLHERGVRGVRYNIGHAGAVPIEEMPLLARKIAPLGWHVQLHVMDDGGRAPLKEMEAVLANLPTDVVIDHIGSIRPEQGESQPGFQTLLRLLEAGRCWVKLSCGYRMSHEQPPYRDMLPYVQALVACRPDRLVWASDWPHVSFKGKMPNTTDLLDLMTYWVPDESVRNRIFVDNPAKLYQF
ncbi:amidohydrolase family protein [Pusillimonas sp.]|uniref:amidohydrolase family protein n=1 Tax=Pusillimonas sp. TaxID=3040095 RepID=UPI0029BF0728|nr:amidohydrolase family protein [Pusillimonas sp.]MDX3895566.1 amidohydrolase family protein [Pusillimonas sp.]